MTNRHHTDTTVCGGASEEMAKREARKQITQRDPSPTGDDSDGSPPPVRRCRALALSRVSPSVLAMQTQGFVKADDSVMKQRKYVARASGLFQKGECGASCAAVTRVDQSCRHVHCGQHGPATLSGMRASVCAMACCAHARLHLQDRDGQTSWWWWRWWWRACQCGSFERRRRRRDRSVVNQVGLWQRGQHGLHGAHRFDAGLWCIDV